MRRKLILAAHLAGAGLFLCGVSMVFIPAAIITAGVLLMAAAFTAKP